MDETCNSFDSSVDDHVYTPILAYSGSDTARSSSSTLLTSNTKSCDESQTSYSSIQFDFNRNISTTSRCTKEHMYRAFLARRECMEKFSSPSSNEANLPSMNEFLCHNESVDYVESVDHVDNHQENHGNELCHLQAIKNCIGKQNIENIITVPHERNDSMTNDEFLFNDENFINIVDYIFRLEARIKHIEKNLIEGSDCKRSLSDESLKLVTDKLDERKKEEDGKDDSIQSIRSSRLGIDSLTNVIASKDTSTPSIHKKPTKDKVKKTGKGTRKKKVLKVRSTCNLEEGQVFSIVVDREPFIISAPTGGVRKGEMIKVCLHNQQVIVV